MTTEGTGSSPRAPAAVFLLIFAAVFNPIVLSAILGIDEWWPATSSGLWAWDVFLVAMAVYLLVIKRKPPKTFRKTYADLALMMLNLGIGFVLINLIALMVLQVRENNEPSAEHFFHQPRHKLRDDPEFLRKLYPGLSDEEIGTITRTPNVVAHPRLEFIERPVKSKYYNVGFENMRYTGFVTAENAKEKINGSVWLFSGSTGFGHGVKDDESLPHYLDKLDEENTYINFAIQGAMQNNEIDSLLLLLKKGYRPKKVVFLDGLNDTIACLATNFRPEELTRFSWTPYAYTYNIRAYHQQKSILGMIGELPVGHLLEQWRANLHPAVVHISEGYNRTDDPEDVYVQNPRSHFLKTDYMYVNKVEHLAKYQAKIRAYYRANLDVIRRIAKAWDFEVVVIFQPNGMILDTNPFIKDLESYKKEEIYQLLSGMYAVVKEDIGKGELEPMIDLSDLHAGCGDCYVDLAHYHPKFNERLAKAILEATQPAPEAAPDRAPETPTGP